jgi:hypothetical protein
MERIPLLNKQKEEAYQLWCDIHQEDLFHRKRLLKEYCHTNDCDIFLAIDYIISQIKDKVFVLYNDRASYISDKDNGETSTTDLENLLYSEFFREGIVNYYEEYAKSNKHYILNSKFSNVQIVSEKIAKEDIKLLEKWKKEFEVKKPKTIVEDTPSNMQLTIGTFDVQRTKELYQECNNVVFKYCKIEDFVNSLNNPDECNLEVKNKNLLYVLYTYFFNFFGNEGDAKIAKLNEKFGITKETYSKKKSSYEKYTPPQKEFNNILTKI